jgi:hypothetical protein
MITTTQLVDLLANSVADVEAEWLAHENFIKIPDDGPGWFPLAKRSGRGPISLTDSIARGRTLWD